MTQAVLLFAWFLALAAGLSFLRAAALLLCRRPAMGRIVYNGYDSAARRQDGAWCRYGAPPLDTPLIDRVVFEDHLGREIRTDLHRWDGPYGDSLLVWYDPARPERATSRGPGHWALATFFLGALAAATFLAAAYGP